MLRRPMPSEAVGAGTGILKTSPHCLQRDFLPASAPSISYRFPQPGQSSTINIDGSPGLARKRVECDLLFHALTGVNGDFTFPLANRKPVSTESMPVSPGMTPNPTAVNG
jgi:hypothetical protein